jgi:membrane fusion protein (multidrug efflux system)
MKRTVVIPFFAITLLVLIACGSKKQQQQGPPPPVFVTTTQASVIDAAYYDEYPGTVVALNQTELRAQVTGYITAIYFKDGDKVAKGQRLYSIDQQLYNANYQQAVANLQVQESNLFKAQKDADRYHELDRQEAIAKQQVDYADAALEAAKKQVQAAKANVNAVRANVNFATITAPFTGTIGISQVRSGTSVVAGQTILNTISTDDPIGVDFSVDQKETYRFAQLEKQIAKAGDSTFSISFGNDVYPFYGKIELIDRAVDPQTGTIKTRLSFPNKEKLLKSGMSTTVRILNNAQEKSVTVPYKSINEQLGEFFVYVVGDSNKVKQRRIVLGKQIGTNVIIRQGLQGGETIVTEGIQNLREGAFITTTPPQPAGAPKK